MSSHSVRAIADAVLYEGYILWPYRRSALKNQRRFTFGGVYPPAHAARHPDDPATMQTEVLLLGSGEAVVRVTVRFLQLVKRTVVDAEGKACETLYAGGETYSSWEEAAEREIVCPALPLAALASGLRVPICVSAASEDEPLPERAGHLVRSWEGLVGDVAISTAEVAPGIWRASVLIENRSLFEGEDRQEALRNTFCSTHTLLAAEGGQFVSLADPPGQLAGLAAACQNSGTWPVLVGEPGDVPQMLSSPIILEDYPRVAPESPGDLFDGGEIDQLLILNMLALTAEEKAEMRASDPRAKEILERTEQLTPEQLMALHGTIREFGMAR